MVVRANFGQLAAQLLRLEAEGKASVAEYNRPECDVIDVWSPEVSAVRLRLASHCFVLANPRLPLFWRRGMPRSIARTRKTQAFGRNQGARARAYSRTPQRNQESSRAGRLERKRRVSHGQAAAGVCECPSWSAQEAHGRSLAGEPQQHTQRPRRLRVCNRGL